MLPPPPAELPSFPSPEDLDLSLPGEDNGLEDASEDELPKLSKSLDIQPVQAMVSKHIFLNVENFKQMLESVNNIRSSLDKSGKLVTEIESLGSEQSKYYHKWREDIKDAHDKILYVDAILFKQR